jgi:stachyose synthetase
LNGSDVDFEWLSDGKLFLNVPWIEEACGVSDLLILF